MTSVHLIITPQINDPQTIAAMVSAAEKLNAAQLYGLYIKRKQDPDLTMECPNIPDMTIYELEQNTAITAQQINEILKNIETIQSLITISNTLSKEWLPAFAALKNIMPITDVIDIEKNLFKRPIFAGNLIETLENNQEQTMMSIRPQFFRQPFTASNNNIQKTVTCSLKTTSFETLLNKENSGLPDLITAKKVISGGRGLGSKENFNKIHELAKHLNTAVGASRAAVDLGYISNEHQVGQTGKIIAPDIYIAYVGDLFEVIDALMK